MNRSIRAPLVALASFAAILPLLSCASDNQLIDDFWMREKPSPASAEAAPAAVSQPTKAATTPQPSTYSAGPPTATVQGGAGMVPAVQGLPPDPGESGTYRLAPGDIIKVEVFQVDELSSEERISERGEIVMPLIGPVRVGGMTPKAAEAHIAGILGKDYLQDPQVDIDISESASQQVTVMGAVMKPGVFPVSGRTTLLQAIALAQGTDKVAKEEEVVVFRPDAVRSDSRLRRRSEGRPAGRSRGSRPGRGRPGGRAALRHGRLHSRGDGYLARIRESHALVLSSADIAQYDSLAPIFSLWVGLQSDNSALSGNHRQKSSTRTVDIRRRWGVRATSDEPAERVRSSVFTPAVPRQSNRTTWTEVLHVTS